MLCFLCKCCNKIVVYVHGPEINDAKVNRDVLFSISSTKYAEVVIYSSKYIAICYHE